MAYQSEINCSANVHQSRLHLPALVVTVHSSRPVVIRLKAYFIIFSKKCESNETDS